MGRHDGFSPQKDVRRSDRARSSVYISLGENQLGLHGHHLDRNTLNNILDAANQRKDRERREVLRTCRSGRYPTRSCATFAAQPIRKDDTSDEESEEEKTRKRRRVVKTRRSSNLFDIEDDEASRDTPSSPPKQKISKRRHIIESDEEEPHSSQHKVEDDDEEEQMNDMYSKVKNRHNITPSDKPQSENDSPISSRSLRHEKRLRMENTQPVKEETNDEEEEEEEVEEEPRQYPLRRERKTVERYADSVQRPKKTSRALRRIEERLERRKQKREFRRRMARSDSSSTGGSDSEGDSKQRRSRGDKDDDKFELRKERSLAKSRNRFIPINMTEKDIASSKNVIRERLRQTGASCSDIDPMTIDNTVFFDQVGGLDCHIQTLKEVVLFPMLYPEIFDRFKINPPKGVVFYGPPGTGKTLVARALANECSRGTKKVAFFMRKGADCLSKWVGESERQLRLLFDQAYAMRPSIIFFDEIDGLAPVRSSRQDQIHASIVSTLLALMDGLDSRGEVVVIGATNRLDTLDPALRRPGRFDRELKFSLPDSTARRNILEIHTKQWGACKPSPEVLEWLADSSSGYCGADLKFLCTEAVLISLRERYPHIYMSNERLVLDPNQVVITQSHLHDAMRRITPASRRDLSIPCRPLEPRTSFILKRTLDRLINTRIPVGYRMSSGVQNGIGSSQLEKVIKALESPPIVPAVRLLLTGSSINNDMGQSSFLLPALLSKLDHLPIFSLAIGKLFADGRPEETLAQTMQSALRAASTTPVILLLPNIDQWYNVVPLSVSHMLATALENMTGFTSLLFLATCDGPINKSIDPVKSLFRSANAFETPIPSDEERKAYMEYIMQPALVPPKKFDPLSYPMPPVATEEDVGPRKLSDREAAELVKLYEGQLRQFRIFLRDLLARLMRDRRFHIFNNPVEVEDAYDYYEIIENPLCMSDMMAKIDKKLYFHPDEFVADIHLIMCNALEYNPDKDPDGKVIRHNAVALRDMCDALIDMELDEKFVEKMEESGRMLKEAGIELKREELPFAKTAPLPQKLTRSAVAAGYVNDVDEDQKSEDDDDEDKDKDRIDDDMEGEPSTSIIKTHNNSKKRRRRHGGYSFGPIKKRNDRKGILKNGTRASSADPILNENGMDKKKNVRMEDIPIDIDDDSSRDRASDEFGTTHNIHSSTVKPKIEPDNEAAERESAQSLSGGTPEKNVEEEDTVMDLNIDRSELDEVIEKCCDGTRGWNVPELERLSSSFIHQIDLLKDQWNRQHLPSKLLSILNEWKRNEM